MVDLSSFRSMDFPGYTQVAINWSADGQFAWIDNYELSGDSGLTVLSDNQKTLHSLPVSPTSKLSWHPVDPVLAYLDENKETLLILHAGDMSIKEWKLPFSFSDFFWSPEGDRIAILDRDGSLWQVDYPKLENPEQLTEPLPAVRNVSWSPDGKAIALISGSDIYIVDTMQ